MALTSKCPRLPYEQHGRQYVLKDRISLLPNDIIGYILSFLPTKEAVATSILSTRWIDVWSFIINVDLDDKSIPSEPDNPLRITFTSMVNGVLLLRKASYLRKFCLNFRTQYQASDVKSWIDYALNCNVEHLDISAALDLDDEYYIPSSLKLFSCTTLTVLELHIAIEMNVPFVLSLPTIKIIILQRVRFLGDGSFTRFLSGCPVLEELHLFRIGFAGMGWNINIVAPLLKRLSLEACFPNHNVLGHTIIINAPSLIFLKISYCYADLYSIVHSPKLIEVVIAFDEYWTQHEGIADFLKGISSVRSLRLTWFDLQSMAMGLIVEGHYYLPNFPNLKSLDLTVDHECDFLADLLQNSPHLKRLVFTTTDESNLEQYKFECEMIPTRLKFIHINISTKLKDYADMINCFLKKAKALQKLTVETEYEDGLEVEKELKVVNSFRKNHDEEAKRMKVQHNYPKATFSSNVKFTLS